MKNNTFKKNTYHIGYAFVTKKVGHKNVRNAMKRELQKAMKEV